MVLKAEYHIEVVDQIGKSFKPKLFTIKFPKKKFSNAFLLVSIKMGRAGSKDFHSFPTLFVTQILLKSCDIKKCFKQKLFSNKFPTKNVSTFHRGGARDVHHNDIQEFGTSNR